MTQELLADADWPLFGWADDIRPALGRAIEAGRPAVLATLFKVEGSERVMSVTRLITDDGAAAGAPPPQGGADGDNGG